MKFDLTAEKEPEVMKSEEIQTETSMEPVHPQEPLRTFPVLDIEVAKKHFADYLKKIDSMLQEAQALRVESEPANEAATMLGTSAKQILKQIEEERQLYVKDYNAYVKSVNAFVKMFTDKLESVERIMKEKIASYRAIQEQKRRELEFAQQKAADELQKKLNLEAKEKGIEPAKVTPPAIPKTPPVTRTETGSAHARKVWTFQIPEIHFIKQLSADISSLWDKVCATKEPEKEMQLGNLIRQLKELAPYLVVSDREVRDAIKAGIREIPGVKIFEDSRTTFRT